MTESATNVIGYWMSEKKSLKLNWTTDFANVFKKYGFSLVKLNLDESLANQGPFSVIVHKLTEVIVKSMQGDKKAQSMISNLEAYLAKHPEVPILDPLDNVRQLLHRSTSYNVISTSHLHEIDVFTPTYVELNSTNIMTNKEKLKTAGVTFPFICKTSIAQSSSESHQMCIIFNEKGLQEVRPPCVAQSFVNHNAVLFKLYVLGERYHVVRRPSLKNFYPSDEKTIFFNSHDVSKPDSKSALSILDEEDAAESADGEGRGRVEVDAAKVDEIVRTLRATLGMDLLGIDVVVENDTARHAIIDINAYPGYDGYPNVSEDFMRCILDVREANRAKTRAANCGNQMLTAKVTARTGCCLKTDATSYTNNKLDNCDEDNCNNVQTSVSTTNKALERQL